jgi:hypothetical protein
MKIKSLYQVKKYYFPLFPSKENANHVATIVERTKTLDKIGGLNLIRFPTDDMHVAQTGVTFWSQGGDNITYFCPDSCVLLIEEDGKYKKILTSDGLVGWTFFDEKYNDCFEEMKTI